MESMPTATVDTPEVPGGIASRFDLTDRRTLIGLGIMAFCLGVMAGARLMRGVPMPHPSGGGGVASPMQTPAPAGERVIFRDVPGPVQFVKGDDCPECAEKKILEQRTAEADAAERARVAAGQSVDPEAPSAFTVQGRGTEVPE